MDRPAEYTLLFKAGQLSFWGPFEGGAGSALPPRGRAKTG